MRGVTIVDRHGTVLAASGEVAEVLQKPPADAQLTEKNGRLLIGEPIRAARLVVNDELSQILAPEARAVGKDLGRITIVSRSNAWLRAAWSCCATAFSGWRWCWPAQSCWHAA